MKSQLLFPFSFCQLTVAATAQMLNTEDPEIHAQLSKEEASIRDFCALVEYLGGTMQATCAEAEVSLFDVIDDRTARAPPPFFLSPTPNPFPLPCIPITGPGVAFQRA